MRAALKIACYHDVVANTDIQEGPVSVSVSDKDGNTTDQITFKRKVAATLDPKVTEGTTTDQADWLSWSHMIYDDAGKVTNQRVYHDVPASGDGSGTGYENYYTESLTGYNTATGHIERTETPGGTITRVERDDAGRVIETWVGTSDSTWDYDNSVYDNLLKVKTIEYDGSSNRVSKETTHVDDSGTDGDPLTINNDRIVEYTYDSEERLSETKVKNGSVYHITKNTYDSQDRAYIVEKFIGATSASANRKSKTETIYDSNGNVSESKQYEINLTTGAESGKYLSDRVYYNVGGRVAKVIKAGDGAAYTLTSYDTFGRATNVKRINGFVNLTIQVNTYNAADQVVKSTASDLKPGSTLQNSNGYLESRTEMWYDQRGRTLGIGDYGKSATTRSVTVPSSTTTLHVTSMQYHADTGELEKTTDPMGRVALIEYDDAGRQIKTVANYKSSPADPAIGEENQEIQYAYGLNGKLSKMTAVMVGSDPDQETIYTYGVTSTNSKINSNELLYSVQYPEDTTPDFVKVEYNRVGQAIKYTDQAGTVHDYTYDVLGRAIQDEVSTFGTNIDQLVGRRKAEFNGNGQVEKLTSYGNAANTTAVRNQVQFGYDDFGKLEYDYQSHENAVITGSTPKVKYTYKTISSTNASNTGPRLDTMVYPDATSPRTLTYGYDITHGFMNQIKDGSDIISSYKHTGSGGIANLTYDQVIESPDKTLTLDSLAELDNFHRMTGLEWVTGTTKHVDLSYNYDTNGNQTAKNDNRSGAYASTHSFAYDGLNRIKEANRNIGAFKQSWDLDSNGNWADFKTEIPDGSGGTDTTNNKHTHNKVNAIGSIANVVNGTASTAILTPTYDGAGNMRTLPKPNDMISSTAYTLTYDAWNRLASVKDGSTDIAKYEYDARSYRIIKEAYDSGTLDETRHFYFNTAWQVIEERKDNSTNPDQQYIWGARYIDDLILRERDTDSNNTLDETLYVLQDMQFNTVALIDDTATVQERIDYTTYGKPSFLNASDVLHVDGAKSDYGFQVLFTGQRHEPKTGLHLFRNRWFHMEIGKFITRDPLRSINGLNLYNGYFAQQGSLDPAGLKIIVYPSSQVANAGRKVASEFDEILGDCVTVISTPIYNRESYFITEFGRDFLMPASRKTDEILRWEIKVKAKPGCKMGKCTEAALKDLQRAINNPGDVNVYLTDQTFSTPKGGPVYLPLKSYGYGAMLPVDDDSAEVRVDFTHLRKGLNRLPGTTPAGRVPNDFGLTVWHEAVGHGGKYINGDKDYGHDTTGKVYDEVHKLENRARRARDNNNPGKSPVGERSHIRTKPGVINDPSGKPIDCCD